MNGIVENRFMIICVFQNDIWFYGNRQLKNVLVIRYRKIVQLKIYMSLCGLWYELYSSLWNMCRQMIMKNIDVLVECMYWISQFYGILCMMYLIDVNVSIELGLQFIVRKMFVMIWLMSISSVRELKKYQKLKFFGV